MSVSQLRLNAECELHGKLHKIVTIDPPHVWLKRPDGETIRFEYLSLINDPSFKPLKSMALSKQENKPYENELAKLKEHKQEEVSKRLEVIRPLVLLERIKEGDLQSLYFFKDKFQFLTSENEDLNQLKQKDLIPRIIKHYKCSRATILRYLHDYRVGGKEGLISDKGKGTNDRTDNRLMMICHPDNPELILDTIMVRLSEEQIPILKEAIEQDYLSKLRLSKAVVHRIVQRKCMNSQVPEIKYGTVCGIINRIDDKAKEKLRNFSKAKQIYDEVARGYADRDALGRLDIIQIDHTKIDMQVIDDVTGSVIERPWLTLGLCVHSREPWCMHLSSEGPSENVVRKAIKHGVFPKNTIREYGTQKEWAASGIPNIIYVDNGMDFKSNDIKRLVNETLESELRHRPVKLPHYGALIERMFGTINRDLIHNIWGTTKSNIVDKGDLSPEKEAFLTLSQLRKIIILYLVDIYPYKPHRGLNNNLSPRVKYMESLQEMGYPPVLFEEDKAQYEIDFLYTEKKPYTRDGVRWENRIYKSDQCQDIIGTRKKKYAVKYDIDDIGTIYLLHPKLNKFIKLYCESPPYEDVAGVNRFTYKLMVKTLRKQGEAKLKEILDTDQIKKGWDAISKEIKTGYTNKKSIRQQVAKMVKVNLEVSTPYSEQQVLQQKKASQALSFEEQLITRAKQAEEMRKRSEK